MQVIETGEIKKWVGREVGVSAWMEMPQERISGFAEVTEDRQWIHLDAQRAEAESPYGRTIAHGFLTLSLLSAMAQSAFRIEGERRMTINYGLNRVRFPSPVQSGARVRGRFVLDEVKEFEGGFQLTWNVVVHVEGAEKPCVAAEWVTRLYR